MPSDGYLSRLGWMNELPVAPFLILQQPAIAAQSGQHVANFYELIYFPSSAGQLTITSSGCDSPAGVSTRNRLPSGATA